ncbi:MAG: hypothetical protein EHM63_03285, partial [Actinobacteria bacterium]
MRLGPVVADEHLPQLAPPGRHPDRAEATSSSPMVQCSKHVIPPAVKGRPHRPAGARSRSRTRRPASLSADLPAARNHLHPINGGDDRPPLASATVTSFVMAAVQAAPVFLDPAASTKKACQLIEDASARGADLVAFSETWLPGYPRWVNAPVAVALKRELGGRYLGASVSVPGLEIDEICSTARRCGVDVVMGVAEIEPISRGTTYCTLVFISADGEVLGKHRKLKPTYGERFAWGEGDGSGLLVHDRPYASISGLNCWEHNMVLPGYA